MKWWFAMDCWDLRFQDQLIFPRLQGWSSPGFHRGWNTCQLGNSRWWWDDHARYTRDHLGRVSEMTDGSYGQIDQSDLQIVAFWFPAFVLPIWRPENPRYGRLCYGWYISNSWLFINPRWSQKWYLILIQTDNLTKRDLASDHRFAWDDPLAKPAVKGRQCAANLGLWFFSIDGRMQCNMQAYE